MTLDEVKNFLDEHPDWAPLFDEEARQIGFQGPYGGTFTMGEISAMRAQFPFWA